MLARTWPQLVRDPGGDRHLVQVYREASFLVRVASEWGSVPLARGGGALFVCRPENATRLRAGLARIGVEVEAREREGRLLFLDAETLMGRFIVDGEPRPERFKPILRGLVSDLRKVAAPGAELRAFGEMVDLLWHRGEKDAARRLEGLWNEAIDELDLRLLCAYAVDNLAEETHAHHLKGICEGHSQLIPEEDPEAFDSAVARALVDVFGEAEAGIVRATFARTRLVPTAMPAAEAVLLALQETRPEAGRRVIRAARSHYVRLS